MNLVSYQKRNMVSLVIVLMIAVMFGIATSASAASSYFSYNGSYISGDKNGEFHHLSTGSAYAKIDDHSGTAYITLYRQKFGWDPSYGTITVTSDTTYKFSNRIDVDSSKYYLSISGKYGSVYGSGTLHN